MTFCVQHQLIAITSKHDYDVMYQKELILILINIPITFLCLNSKKYPKKINKWNKSYFCNRSQHKSYFYDLSLETNGIKFATINDISA